MAYTRFGPFGSKTRPVPVNAPFLNAVEECLLSLPLACPYERRGPFVNGTYPVINSIFFNRLEDALAQVERATPYQRYGPFCNGNWCRADFLNHIEDVLVEATRRMDALRYDHALLSYELYEKGPA